MSSFTWTDIPIGDTSYPDQINALGRFVAGLTASDIGLGNVDNTSDKDKPVSDDQQVVLDGKVTAVEGKGLSTEDFTTQEKEKLAALSIDISVIEW